LLNIHGQHHTEAELDGLYVTRKQGGRGLMQLEEAFIVGTAQVVDYVDSKEVLPIQIFRTLQHNIISTMLQTTRRLKRELQRGTRQIKDSTAEEKKKDGEGRACMDNSHVT
jgi:hypothetical protein